MRRVEKVEGVEMTRFNPAVGVEKVESPLGLNLLNPAPHRDSVPRIQPMAGCFMPPSLTRVRAIAAEIGASRMTVGRARKATGSFGPVEPAKRVGSTALACSLVTLTKCASRLAFRSFGNIASPICPQLTANAAGFWIEKPRHDAPERSDHSRQSRDRANPQTYSAPPRTAPVRSWLVLR